MGIPYFFSFLYINMCVFFFFLKGISSISFWKNDCVCSEREENSRKLLKNVFLTDTFSSIKIFSFLYSFFFFSSITWPFSFLFFFFFINLYLDWRLKMRMKKRNIKININLYQHFFFYFSSWFILFDFISNLIYCEFFTTKKKKTGKNFRIEYNGTICKHTGILLFFISNDISLESKSLFIQYYIHANLWRFLMFAFSSRYI